jgi:branched-chain amino acid transport system ATP-binding protein
MKILQVKELTVCFGALHAVNKLSFELEKGEVLGIAGPNGAGKSTVFNAINGLYKYSGDIIFDDVRLTRLRPHQICHQGIARTFQIPQFVSTLSLLDNIKAGAIFGGRSHGAESDKETTKEVIKFLRLEGKENIIASHLSLYDKKRTMLGAALATKPKMLLVDEPASGLSPTETKEFVTSLQKINKELGLSIIIIEHLMKVLTKVVQQLLIMEEGRKICIGPPEEVVKDEKVIEIYLGRGHA